MPSYLLLIIITAMGAGLRLWNLDLKPMWIDEFATVILSIGHNYRSIPNDQLLSVTELTELLKLDIDRNILEIAQNFFDQDHHPLLFFILNHWWLNFLVDRHEIVSATIARSLPVLFGTITIPITYLCGKKIFKSQRMAQIAAGLMAVSPYAVNSAQEARHYTLVTIWVIISISCLILTCQSIQDRQRISLPLMIGWGIVNNLGMVTHYFFIITVIAETITFWLFWWKITKIERIIDHAEQYFRDTKIDLCWAIVPTLIGMIISLGIFQHYYQPEMTVWLETPAENPLDRYIMPIVKTLGILIPMTIILPSETFFHASSIGDYAISISSGLVSAIFLWWLLPILNQGIRAAWSEITTRILVIFASTSILLLWIISYTTKKYIIDESRFHFVYFPSILMLVTIGCGYAGDRSPSHWLRLSRRGIVSLVLLMATISSIFVVNNFCLPKMFRSDQLMSLLEQDLSPSTLITLPNDGDQIASVGRILGIAVEMQRSREPLWYQRRKFLINLPNRCHRGACQPNLLTIDRAIHTLPSPVAVWLVNYADQAVLTLPQCTLDRQPFTLVDGYRYKLYHCQN